MSYTNGLDKPSDYFTTKLFTGNGGTNAITGVGFQPDWIWFKNRTSAQSHAIVDSVRGRKGLQSNATDTEYTLASGKDFGTFDSDGFTVLTPQQLNSFNYNTGSIVSWNWKAGTSFTNDASSTGIGSIDSAGSFNNDSGFSIVSYTGTGSAGTIKHGLNSVPSVIIIKVLTNTANDWCVYHQATGNNKSTFLNESNAVSSNAFMNNTTPTSSVFSVDGSNYSSGSSRNYIAYCFAEKQGYSKFGSYTGNGGGAANGNFIYTGFSPAFVMIKNTTHTYNWVIQDNKRKTFNPLDRYIYPNTSGAEAQNSIYDLDLLSNGFKVRSQRSETNDTNNGYIFMCFAENPFVTSTGVPATAR
jgi:hypothetical protein